MTTPAPQKASTHPLDAAHPDPPAGAGPALHPSPPSSPAAHRPTSLPPPPDRARAPTLTHHHSHSRPLILPTPEILGSVVGGAHYAGALSPHERHVHPAHLEKHKRSLSMTAGDPVLEETYRGVMEDLQELFCGRPTLEILERRWRRDAEFEDPLCKCRGFEEYAPLFFALPKVCSNSQRLAVRILSATIKPNRLVFSQSQEYTVRFFGTKKLISSFVLVDLDEDLKIIRLVDQWNGEDPPTRWGALLLRKLSAKVVPLFIHVPRYSARRVTSAV